MKLTFSVFRTMMLSALLLVGMAVQARVISGTVKDPTGETIISASVVVKGTTIGTVTDFDGNYTLDVPDDAKVLVFSYIGMQTQELNITGDVMNVVLSENSEVLEEVVVTGYGTTKKRDLVTSVASVSADQIKDVPVSSAAEALEGIGRCFGSDHRGKSGCRCEDSCSWWYISYTIQRSPLYCGWFSGK